MVVSTEYFSLSHKPRSEFWHRNIWGRLGADVPNMGVESLLEPFVRQADLYIAMLRVNVRFCRQSRAAGRPVPSE